MTYSIITAILIAITIAFLTAWNDSFIINRDYEVKKRSKRIRSAIVAVILSIIALLINSVWSYGAASTYNGMFVNIISVIITEPIRLIATILMLHFGVYWTTFDILVNEMTGKPWNYTSYKSGDKNRVYSDILFDIFPERYAGWIQFIIKVSIFVTCLLIVIT